MSILILLLPCNSSLTQQTGYIISLVLGVTSQHTRTKIHIPHPSIRPHLLVGPIFLHAIISSMSLLPSRFRSHIHFLLLEDTQLIICLGSLHKISPLPDRLSPLIISWVMVGSFLSFLSQLTCLFFFLRGIIPDHSTDFLFSQPDFNHHYSTYSYVFSYLFLVNLFLHWSVSSMTTRALPFFITAISSASRTMYGT